MRLIHAQFVKPYRKSNNDVLDAEAIAEAVTKREHAYPAAPEVRDGRFTANQVDYFRFAKKTVQAIFPCKSLIVPF